jgi:hypothetical protein
MQPLLVILGALIIGLANYSAEARGMGHGGGRAMGHFAGRFGFHPFGFNRFEFNRFGFNRFGFNRFDFNRFGFNRFGFNRFGFNRFNGGWDWGWGYGWGGYGGDDYSDGAVPPNVVVLMPQPTPGAVPALPRGDLPPCHETSFRVVVDRGMGCSVPMPTAGAAPSQADNPPPLHADHLTQADDPPPSRTEYLPPCHEVTAVGPVVDRGMACSRGSG